MATIKTIIEAIGIFLRLFTEFWNMYKKSKREGWHNDGNEVIKKVKDAKTDEERRKLVADSLSGLVILPSCKTAPKMELCIIGKTALLCNDVRKDPPDYDVDFKDAVGYVATNPDDYANYVKWCQRRGEK